MRRIAPHVAGASIALILAGLLAFRREASVGAALPELARIVSSELNCSGIGMTSIKTAPPLRWQTLSAVLSDQAPSARLVSSASLEDREVGLRLYSDGTLSLVLPPDGVQPIPTAEMLSVIASDEESLFATGLLDAPIRIFDSVALNRKSGLGVWTRIRHRSYGQEPETQTVYLRCSPRYAR